MYNKNKNFNEVKKIFDKFSPFAPTNCDIYNVMVRFLTNNVDGNPVDMRVSIGELYDDWYEECLYCPENDAVLQSLELSYKERTEIVDKKLLKNFAFEDMMEIIEEMWP